MGTFFGWEASNLNNNGASIYYQVAGSATLGAPGFTLTGVQLSVACEPGSGASGFAEVLAYGFAYAGGVPNFSSPTYQISSLSQSPYIQPGTFVNPSSVSVAGNSTPQYCMFSVIMKAVLPNNPLQCNLYIPQNNLWLPAGAYLVLHMDHGGNGPLDCEMQGMFQGILTGFPI
jgi:hypothetical protein